MAEVFDDELNNLFVEEQELRGIKKDVTIEDIEKAYMKMSEKDDLTLQREKEKMEIIQKIKDTRTKLLKCKNIKNMSATGRRINQENAERRKKLKNKILDLQDELDKLKMEIDGSKLNHRNFVEGSETVQSQEESFSQNTFSFASEPLQSLDSLNM